MRKILLILLFLQAAVPSVVRASFPLSFEKSIVLFIYGVITPSLWNDAKSILSNPGPYVNFIREKVTLTCDTFSLIGNGLKFLCVLGCIAGTLTGRYSTAFDQNGKMRYFTKKMASFRNYAAIE